MVRPSIYGTAAIFTAERLMYYSMSSGSTYILLGTGDLLEEVGVDGVHLG